MERRVVFVAGVGVMLLGAAASCGGRSGATDVTDAGGTELDADSDSGSGDDAGRRCDPTAPFGTAVLVPGLAGYATPGKALRLTLTEDELDALLITGDTVVEVSRSSVDAPFGGAVEQTALSSGATQLLPSGTAVALAPDGLRVAIGGATKAGHSAIARAVRAVRGGPFAILAPTTWTDGPVDSLFYVPTAEDAVYGVSAVTIFRQSPTRGLQVLPYFAATYPAFAVVNRAETELYTRVPGGIARISRSDINQLWSAPEVVPDLSTQPDRFVTWLSPDGCRAYLGSTAGHALLVSQRGWAGASDAAVDPAIDSSFDATPGLGNCITWVDHTNDPDVRLTWDFAIKMNPDRCSRIRAGSTVRWSGNFLTHPLEPFGGDVPNPIPNSDGADSGLPDGGPPTIVVAFPEAGTFGYNCENHPGIMSGAITVVP